VIAVARLAIVVGIAGLLPFLAAIVGLFTVPEQSVVIVSYFYLYSAGILAFMAGIYWPLAMQLENRCYPISPLVTMLLSQVFFITAGIGLLLPIAAQIAVYTLAYVALYVVDARWMRGYWPDWYLKLRLALTAVVLACQVAAGVWFFMAQG
jgi:uncharacterized membrane protein